MLTRCLNPNATHFDCYGGRGISVCDRWRSFEHFFEDMGERPSGTSLDRIDNSRGYSPENCRWADHKTQMRNTRANRRVEFGGVTKTTIEWAEEYGVNARTLCGRLARGAGPSLVASTTSS